MANGEKDKKKKKKKKIIRRQKFKYKLSLLYKIFECFMIHLVKSLTWYISYKKYVV